ncbi:MAG: hypothetical protein AAF570_02830 [Bacteroidota bacterium]
MSQYFQSLLFTPGYDRICLRELTGQVEQMVEGTHAREAIRLVDRLLVKDLQVENGLQDAAHLSSADRDRVLAGIFQRTYGDKIASTMNCSACGEPFDLDFSLMALVSHHYGHGQAYPAMPDTEGQWTTPEGLTFRLPTGKDELAVLSMKAEDAA